MISFILIALSAICCAVMDVTQFHYSTSVFTKFNNPTYWNGSVSWLNKYVDRDDKKGFRKCFFGLLNYPAFLTDAWHLFKSLMIVFFSFAIVMYSVTFNKLIDFFIIGAIWNIIFIMFYNWLLVIKK